MPREVILVTDAYYRTALDNQMKANSDYYAKRAALEQFVGNEVFSQFEQDLKKRETKLKFTERLVENNAETYRKKKGNADVVS